MRFSTIERLTSRAVVRVASLKFFVSILRIYAPPPFNILRHPSVDPSLLSSGARAIGYQGALTGINDEGFDRMRRVQRIGRIAPCTGGSQYTESKPKDLVFGGAPWRVRRAERSA